MLCNLFCDDEKVSNAAIKLTVNTWFNAALSLISKGILFGLFYSPQLAICLNIIVLDYLGNFVKQIIINEKVSFEKNFDSLKKEFLFKM